MHAISAAEASRSHDLDPLKGDSYHQEKIWVLLLHVSTDMLFPPVSGFRGGKPNVFMIVLLYVVCARTKTLDYYVTYLYLILRRRLCLQYAFNTNRPPLRVAKLVCKHEA